MKAKTDAADVLSMYRFDRLADHRVPDADSITEETIRKYHELGYVAIDRVLTEEEVAAALRDIDDVIQGRIVGPNVQFYKKLEELNADPAFHTPEGREMAVRKLHKYADYCPALRHIVYHPKILHVLRLVFGEEPVFTNEAQALLKPPSGAGMEKPWHQDMAYRNFAYSKPVAGVWVALDEASLENGCMHVVPRFHRYGPIPHYAVRDWQICDNMVDVENDAAVPLAPGGVLVFHGLLHHGTPPNRSNKRRRGPQLHYHGASARKLTPQEYKLIFTNEMTNAEC